MRPSVIILFLFLATDLAAQENSETELPLGHLKKFNPNTLYVDYVSGEGCPGSYESDIDLILVQSRIRRMKKEEFKNSRTAMFDVSLHLRSQCLKIADYITYFHIRAEFWKYSVEEETVITFPIPLIGVMGHDVNAKEGLRKGIRRTMEQALSPYLKANFDL